MDNIFNHDYFNTWQKCKNMFYFKYVKKLAMPEFENDYELGKTVHALMDYYLRGMNIEHLLENLDEESLKRWELLNQSDILHQKIIKTEWAFNARLSDTAYWLIGRMDAIFYNEENGKYIIADWKTGKYIAKNIDENFQHKLYLYAFCKCAKDLGIDVTPENVEFQYIKITDILEVIPITYSLDEHKKNEQLFVNIIKDAENVVKLNKFNCTIKKCKYSGICLN